MMHKSKFFFLFCILLVCFSSCDLMVQDSVSKRIIFSEFHVLQSVRSEGNHLDLTKDDPGVNLYQGENLQPNPSIENRMYTFKNIFFLDNELKEENLSLFSGPSEYPYNIYLNDHLIYTKGRFTDHYNSSLYAANGIFLSPSLLNYGEDNSLVIQIYPKEEVWSLSNFYLDKNTIISRDVFFINFFRINILQGFFFMSIFIALYMFLLYFTQKKKNKAYLFFALACISFAMAYCNYSIHFESINELLMEALAGIGYILLSTFLFLFCLDFTEIFNEKKIVIFTILGLGVLVAVFIAIQPSKEVFFYYFTFFINIVVVPEVVIEIGLLIYALIKKKNNFVIPILIAFGFVIYTTLHDVFYLNNKVIPYAWLASYGFFAIVVATFIILAMKQTILFHQAQQQSADLIVNQARIQRLNIELTKQKDSFYRFVPTQFLELLGKKSAVDIKLGDSSLMQLSVLFSDIRQFTSLSEKMEPDQNFQFLNSYLFRMEKAIQQNNGFVDKYIGDAIMALFSSQADKSGKINFFAADTSLTAALNMKSELVEFNRYLTQKNYPNLDIGIGINTGMVMLGTVGSKTRMDTTVIGDSVNISSRLENLTKFYKTRVLISEDTKRALDRPDDFSLRVVDKVTLAGKKDITHIYELLDQNDPMDQIKIDNTPTLLKGINLYHEKAFVEAKTLFESIRINESNDFLPKLYSDRCSLLINNPPEADWDGTFHSKKIKGSKG